MLAPDRAASKAPFTYLDAFWSPHRPHIPRKMVKSGGDETNVTMFLRATSSQNKRRGMKSYQCNLKLQIDVARAQGHKSDDDLRCRSMQHLWRCGSNARAPLCSLYLWRMHQGNVRQRWILGIICLIDS